MVRLTEKTEQGEWRLKGVSWDQLNAGKEITRDTSMLLYGALYKLMEYEDTGLNPKDVERLDDFEQSQTRILMKKLAEEKKKHQWIPVEEQLPDHECDVLMSFGNFYTPLIGRYETDENGGSFYVGDDEESCVSQNLFVNAWMPLPEPYRP